MSETPDDITREAADIVLGFAKDLTNADAMIEAVAKFALAERLSATERAAKIAEEIGTVQSDGWTKVPKPNGCGGAIAASNTGFMIAAAIRSQP